MFISSKQCWALTPDSLTPYTALTHCLQALTHWFQTYIFAGNLSNNGKLRELVESPS